MTDFSEELRIARKAAKAGADVIRKNFGDVSNARQKSREKGLVTDTDLEAEKVILDILSTETNYGFLSEESGESEISKGIKWIVDPLDGTTNFARSLPFFAVSVALADQNNFLVGVITDVIQNREFYAIKGGGAFCDGKNLILPQQNENFKPALFLNHGYHEYDRNNFKKLTSIFVSGFDILKLGTTALELCFVAQGAVDGFICSGDEIWDFAAGVVIATEAGCLFTDWQGNPWDGKNKHLLVARPEVHAQLVKKICDLQSKSFG